MSVKKSIRVNVSRQQLQCIEDRRIVREFGVSTSGRGTGQQAGSYQTPLGKHNIRAKIGDGQPPDAVFVGRRPTGEIWTTELHNTYPDRDWVLTRILWLSGTEPGFNRLGSVDSMRRYIYIHGTPETEQIGRPVSHGCIRMRSADLLWLYDWTPVGTEVVIAEDS
ncbi:MAG: L,D-transpeptidase [Gammaproteobacteria bacterium]|nr:L,D-transpeptidase [Gammaproteobacteria bacterium]